MPIFALREGEGQFLSDFAYILNKQSLETCSASHC